MIPARFIVPDMPKYSNLCSIFAAQQTEHSLPASPERSLLASQSPAPAFDTVPDTPCRSSSNRDAHVEAFTATASSSQQQLEAVAGEGLQVAQEDAFKVGVIPVEAMNLRHPYS